MAVNRVQDVITWGGLTSLLGVIAALAKFWIDMGKMQARMENFALVQSLGTAKRELLESRLSDFKAEQGERVGRIEEKIDSIREDVSEIKDLLRDHHRGNERGS